MSKSVTKKLPAKGFKDAQVIRLLVNENPKRGDSRTRFARYRTGMKVADYVTRCVKAGNPASLARADLRWERKLIAIR
jgi:hypothetical protein